MKFLTALVDFSLIAAYFVLADYVAPKLVQSGQTWLWWLILFALVSSSYVFTRWSAQFRKAVRAERSGAMVLVAYTFLLITLFLYDLSIRPVLDKHGFGNAWIVGLLLTFLTVALGAWKSREEGKGPNARPQ